MTSYSKRIRFSVALALVLVAAPALAEGGRVPIWEPTTIVDEGSYFLTQNVSAIDITGSNIELDLNGFRVGAGGIEASGSNIAIRNGTITGDGGRVEVTDSTNVVVENLLIVDATTTAVQMIGVRGFRVRDVAIQNPALAGVIVNGSVGGVVERNVIEGAGAIASNAGIVVTGGSSGITVVGNRIENASFDGIFVESGGCNGCSVAGNTVSASGRHGINVNGTWVHARDNVVMGNTASGLRIGGSLNTYGGNSGRGNGGGSCTAAAFSNELCVETGVHISRGDNLLPGLI